MFDPYWKRRQRLAARFARRMDEVDPSLPVDGDVPRWRTPTPRAGDMMDELVADLVKDRSPFFDEVCARWAELFPDLKAKPGKWVSDGPNGNGKIFLNVGSAAGSFALRPTLPAIRRKLAQLASAPRRFSLYVEIKTPDAVARTMRTTRPLRG